MKKVCVSTVLFFLLVLAAADSLFAQNFWQQTNGPYGGFIRVVAISPSGHIFAGTQGGGAFRSTDNGGSWVPVNTGLPIGNVSSFVINAKGDIFAAAGGVFRSTDNGSTWTPVNTGLTNNTNVQILAINASGHIFAGTFRDGVFRSTDNGSTWKSVNTGLPNAEVSLIAINANGDIFMGIYGTGIFRSTDNGSIWTLVNTGLTYLGVRSLAINANGDIFVGTSCLGVFRSTNNGNTWTQLNSGLTFLCFYSLAINANQDIFAGTNAGLIRSTDNGNTWTPVNIGLPSVSILNSITFNTDGHIFVGTSGMGVIRSTDNGTTWTSVNTGLMNTDVRSLAINANGHIFAGTYGSGVFRSTDNGSNWTSVNTGLTGTIFQAFAINSNGHIFTLGLGGVFRSTDNGSSWTPVNTDLTNASILAINSIGSIFAGTTGGRVFRSTDNGITWVPVNIGLTNTTVFSLAINSSGHIFAGTIGGGIFRSTDNGGSWAPVNTGLTNTEIFCFAINSSGHIFAGSFGNSNLFRSTDNGSTWTLANNGLTFSNVQSLAINTNGSIFAGTSDGVFRSMNNGENWTKVNTGIPNTQIPSLAINSNGYIFSGTFGNGVFRSVQSTLPPSVANPIPNQSYAAGAPVFIRNLNSSPVVFTDPNGGGLTYTAGSSAPSIATANISGSTLTVTPLSAGSATITVTAKDSKSETAQTTFTMTVISYTNTSQWKFVKVFPHADFKGGLGCHGLAVDPDGKVWIQLFSETDSVSVSPGIPKKPTRVIYVFNPDGNPASFSPIKTITIGGAKDSLTTPPSLSNRGLRADHQGNILVASFDRLFRLNYKTGAGMNKAIPQPNSSLAAPAVDASGNIFTAQVIPDSYPIRIFDKDFNFIKIAVDTSKGFSRSFEVSHDGNTIYFAGFNNHAVYRYTRANQSSSFGKPDTVLKGFDAESVTFHPRTRYLWVSAGSYNDLPNRFPGAKTSWSPNTWYAYNTTTNQVVDSLKWVFNIPNNILERPRAIAFSAGGDTAYIACFGASDYPPVQMFVRTVSGANRPPALVSAIPNQNLAVNGAPFTRDLNASPRIFSDPDGDALTYTASSSAPSIATANLSGSILAVALVAAGSATITVTANDGRGGTAQATFIVTANRPPALTNTLPNQTLTANGAVFSRDLNASPAIFSDPDGDALTYTASSSVASVATANISGSTLRVTSAAAGNATITVTANDPRGGTASTTFTVTVNAGSTNQPPVVSNAIANQTLILGTTQFVRNLNATPAVFNDPNGDTLAYTTSSSFPTIATASLSGSTLTVAPISSGSATITLTANDGKGGSSSTTFNAAINSNRAPIVTHTPPSEQNVDQPLAISVNLTDEIAIASASLSYRRGGEARFVSVPLTAGSGSYQATIPATAVTTRGLEYFIKATDPQGLETRTVTFAIAVRVAGQGETKRSPQPGGTEQSAYRLISVPLDLDSKSARVVLEDDLGTYNIFNWRCYEVRPDQTRAEYPNISEMTLGKTFWLIVKEGGKVIDSGPGKSNPTLKKYAIVLPPKWSLVGNPFNFPIPVSNLQLRSSSEAPELRSYTGTWNDPVNEAPIIMQPFQGYAVFNSLTIVDTLFVNPDLSVGSGAFRHSQLAESEPLKGQLQTSWSIHILAQCQQARDIDNIAGVSANASDTHDELDRPEPPVIGEYVSAYFPHSEWKTLSEKFCTDFRPEPTDGAVWEFEVKTNIRDLVHLSFEGLESMSPELEVWVVDDVLKIAQNLREKNYYSVAGTEHSKRLNLVVGKRDFIDKQLASVEIIPSAYELSQNFPNPFNPVTTIRFGLPNEARVMLKVYNLFGQEVATLINNELKNAGYHAAIWDGRNNSGQAAVSGVYFMRLRAGPSTSSGSAGSRQVFVRTRKMVLVE